MFTANRQMCQEVFGIHHSASLRSSSNVAWHSLQEHCHLRPERLAGTGGRDRGQPQGTLAAWRTLMKFGCDETFQDYKEASDRLIDFTVELSAIEMEPLVPRAGSAAADQRSLSFDIPAGQQKFAHTGDACLLAVNEPLLELENKIESAHLETVRADLQTLSTTLDKLGVSEDKELLRAPAPREGDWSVVKKLLFAGQDTRESAVKALNRHLQSVTEASVPQE